MGRVAYKTGPGFNMIALGLSKSNKKTMKKKCRCTKTSIAKLKDKQELLQLRLNVLSKQIEEIKQWANLQEDIKSVFSNFSHLNIQLKK